MIKNPNKQEVVLEEMLAAPHQHYAYTNKIVDLVEAAKQKTDSKQAKRLVDHLLEHPDALTEQICRSCSIVNISAAANYIRPALQQHGLTIVARKPPHKILNQFGEPSMSHRWSLQIIHDQVFGHE